MSYFVVFLVAFVASFVLTPLAQWVSHRWGLVAQPGGRRKHAGLVPKLGGVPLMGALLISAVFIFWLLPPSPQTNDAQLLQGVLVGTVLVFVGGLVDDHWELSPRLLFGVQLVGSAVAMWHQVFIERFTSPFTGEIISFQGLFPIIGTGIIFLLTLFWLVGMVNTVNFLDGLDGLAAGVSTIAALIFAWHSYRLGQTAVAAFPLALAGALLGFLPYNFAPARIFLGSAGAYLLGYQLATLSIISPAKIATALLVLAVPILDVAWRIADRLWHGRSPFHGDRGHLHHMLFDRGVPIRWIVLGYYTVSLAFGLVAIFAPTPLAKLVMLVVLGTAVFALILFLTFKPAPVTDSSNEL